MSTPSSETAQSEHGRERLYLFLIAAIFLIVAIILPTTQPPQIAYRLTPTPVSALPNWPDTDLTAALSAFNKSCAARAKADPGAPLSKNVVHADLAKLYGTWKDWQPLCQQARALAKADAAPAAIQAFFENAFRIVEISPGTEETALFTGYYEPQLRASRTRSPHYATPLLKRPDDLITVNLENFLPELRGRKIRGRIDGQSFIPYPDRAEIATNADLIDENVLFWAEDPTDVFFLHIQGSGRLKLDTGEVVRVGYAAQNGHAYTAIGKTLIDWNELDRETVSMQSIRHWLNDNPDRRDQVFNTNPSYIFFRELSEINENDGPLGAQNVPLTPHHSIAVDLSYHALGVPVWLDAELPNLPGTSPTDSITSRLQTLMITQDTGGAIKGPVRGDVFWGFGPEAEQWAGHMKHPGRLFLFVPAHLAQTLD